jgi:ABC-type spermidine/putrescine transport system permease subunit I
MILPLYATMKTIDKSFIEASRTMGASDLRTFWSVYLPLSLPGVAAGSLLVFILALGFYVTPALLGGPKDTLIAVYIQQQVGFLNWGEATAMATLLLVIVMALLLVYDRVLGMRRMFENVGR